MFWLDIQNGTFHGSCGVTFQSTLIFPGLVFEILKISCRGGVTVSFRTRCPAGPSVADMLLSAVHWNWPCPKHVCTCYRQLQRPKAFFSFRCGDYLITGLITLACLGCVPWSANFSPTVATLVIEESIGCLGHTEAAVLMCYESLCRNFVVQCLLFVCHARALIIVKLLLRIISCTPIHYHWITVSSQTGVLNVRYSCISVIWRLLSVNQSFSGNSLDLNIMKELRSPYFWRLLPFRVVFLFEFHLRHLHMGYTLHCSVCERHMYGYL